MVFVERSIGLITLLVVGSVAALATENAVSEVLRIPFLILAFGSLAAFWGATRLPIGERGERKSEGIGRIGDMLRRFVEALRTYRGQGRVIGRAMLATILLQVNVILCWGVLARALEIDLPIESFFLVVPALALVLLIPVSINGIGLRENGLLALLVPLGVGAPEVVALAWVDYAIQLGWGAAGGVVYVFHRRSAGLEGRERDTRRSIRKTRFGGSCRARRHRGPGVLPLVSRRYAGGRGIGLPGARFRPSWDARGSMSKPISRKSSGRRGTPSIGEFRPSRRARIPNLTPTTTPDSCLSDTEARSSSRWGPKFGTDRGPI